MQDMRQDDTAPATGQAPTSDRPDEPAFSAWLRALRPAHWIKNLLLFVPPLAAHHALSGELALQMLLAFISFSLLASALYLHNDLQDVENDRQHPSRNRRPVAAGIIGTSDAAKASMALALLALLVALPLGGKFLIWLIGYGTLVLCYSHWLKYRFPLDLFALTSFYLLRIIAGASAAGVLLGPWLPAFSACTFVSLALLKRYRELRGWHTGAGWDMPSPHYQRLGEQQLCLLGLVSGFAATIILLAYAFSPSAETLYPQPSRIMLAAVIFALWQIHMWRQASRMRMDTDPVLFAVRDHPSLLAALMLLLSILLAALPAGRAHAEPGQQQQRTETDSRAPFGLHWGMHAGELRERGIYLVEQQRQGNMVSYLSKNLPYNLAGVRSYTLLFDEELGLVRVQYVSTTFSEDQTGADGRDRYRKLKLLLLEKYGVPEVDEVVGLNETLKEQGFYACLQSEGCGWWHSTYHQDELMIRLQLHGSGPDSGFLSLDYQPPEFQESLARWEWLQQRELDRAL